MPFCSNILTCHFTSTLFRTGDDSCNIGDLYQFADKTGILSTHEQCLAQTYEDSQVGLLMEKDCHHCHHSGGHEDHVL